MMSNMSAPSTRRSLLASSLAVAAVVGVGGTAVAAMPAANALPAGHRRGPVAETASDGAKIYQVLDGHGKTVGYTFEDGDLATLKKSSQSVEREPEMDGAITVRSAGTDVAACAAGIAGFIGLTIFPQVRLAKLAWRLGKLVAKYGPKLVARIFKGARGIAGQTVEKDIIEIGKELSGVATLAACGL